MASKPFFDEKRRTWYLKYKPNPCGGWKKQPLGKHEGNFRAGTTPKVPPSIEARAREFAEIEYRAKNQLAPPSPQAKPLDEFLEAYSEAHSLSSAVRSNAHVRRGVKRFVEFARSKGILTLQGVGQSTCRDYLEMRSRVVAPSTLRTERGFLMGAWTRALEDELIGVNPWTGARVKGRATDSPITFWCCQEINRIAASCAKPWQADLVLFMANTGLRISTALASRWSWINRADNSLRIQKDRNVKTTYLHVLSEDARSILDRRKAGSMSPLIFPSDQDEGVIPYSTTKQIIDKAIAKAGVKHGTPHDLRHSYGRLLALAGVPITVIRSQMGHSSIAMTQRYMTTDQTHAASFVEKLNLGGSSIKNE